jgi:hypothetical protein
MTPDQIAAAQDLSSALERDDITATLERDDSASARTLYLAGRGAHSRGDMPTAKLYFGLAEKLFARTAEMTDAYIARKWYNFSRED